MAKNALIVGPPRSGTSLASSIFARAGYYVGAIGNPGRRAGDDHNPFGYFEADRLVERNAALLGRAGYPFHNTWTFRPELDLVSERMISELAPEEEDLRLVADYEPHVPWLWKDPRFCFTLPYWWKVLDPSSTVVYLATRDLADAYPSFRRKGWCGRTRGERKRVENLMRRHARAARRAVESLGIPHVSVDYGDYASDPVGVAARVSEAFDIEVAPESLNFRPELDHSDLRGRMASGIRLYLRRLPRERVERVAAALPRPLLGLLFPERLHVRPPAEVRATQRPGGTDAASVGG